MGIEKNVASQKALVFAFDKTDNEPVTGDAANITGKIRIDFGSATAIGDTNPTEIEDGYYEFDLTQAETNGKVLDILPESATGDVQVIGVPGRIFTTAPNATALGIESDGDLTKVNTLDGHTAQTADNDTKISLIQAATITNAAGADIAADIIAVKAETATIVADTNDLQTNQGNWVTATGFSTHDANAVVTAMESSDLMLSLGTGTAQAGSTTTITLASGESSSDNYYVGQRILTTGGTGAGQFSYITGYVGATRVATVSPAFVTAPDNTTTYQRQADTSGGSGSGPYEITITYKDDSDVVMQGVAGRLTDNVAVNLTGTSDVNGQIVFRAPASGTYTISGSKTGYNQPGSEQTVSGASAEYILTESANVTGSSDNELFCTGYGYVFDDDSAADSGVTVYCRVKSTGSTTGSVPGDGERTTTTDSNGRYEFADCFRGMEYEFTAEDGGFPDGESYGAPIRAATVPTNTGVTSFEIASFLRTVPA